MSDAKDLFFSYRRHDLERARPLLQALAEVGIRVWRDEDNIPEQSSITAEVREAISNSKAFLAFYSRTYPLSPACQQELTAAWLAAQNTGSSPNRRVWIVNPEFNFGHISEALRDQLCPRVPDDGMILRKLASDMKAQLGVLDGTLRDGIRPAPKYFGMAPIQARRFVGRLDELWHLHAKLTARRMSVITGVYGQTATQLRGLGGNGKSLLAREYSIRFGAAYPGGVFWLNAQGHDGDRSLDGHQRRALRQDQIREFALRCGVATDGLDSDLLEGKFWEVLEGRNEPCLWIIDDVPPQVDWQELEKFWIPRWDGASTLITTRSKEWGAMGNVVDLGLLSAEDGLALLSMHRQPSSETDEKAARQIVEILGGHPLAIDVAGGYLQRGYENLESYVSSLLNPIADALELASLLRDSLPTGHERGISATLLKSISQLGPDGLDFLRLASQLAVAPISLNLVSKVLDEFNSNVNPSRKLRAVDQAETLSLCEQAGSDTRTVHTLVSRTIQFRLRDEDRSARMRVATVEVLVRNLWRADNLVDASLAVDIPHARHIVDGGMSNEQETLLGLSVSRHGYAAGDFRGARALQEAVFTADERLLGREHPNTATAAMDLGQSLYLAGELDRAQSLQEYAVDTNCRLLGDDHQNTNAAKRNLAQTLYRLGHLARARELQEDVLRRQERVLGPRHQSTLTTLNNLAMTLSAQSDFNGARRLHERVLEARREVLGAGHRSTLTSMSNLAQTMKAQRDFVNARPLEEAVLAGRQSLLGDRHPDTLNAVHNLATTLSEMAEFNDAVRLLEEAVPTMKAVLGAESPQVLSSLTALGEIHERQGNPKAALPVKQEVFATSVRAHGKEHPDTLDAATHLASTLSALDRFSEARALQHAVLDATCERLGEDDPQTMQAKMFLFGILQGEGDPIGARKIADRIIASFRRVGAHNIAQMKDKLDEAIDRIKRRDP